MSPSPRWVRNGNPKLQEGLPFTFTWQLVALAAVALAAITGFYLYTGQYPQSPQQPAGQGLEATLEPGQLKPIAPDGNYALHEGTTVIERGTSILMLQYGKIQKPSVTVISGADALKQRQRAIYANAKDGMLLVQWPDLLVIYDPSTGEVVQELSINTFGG